MNLGSTKPLFHYSKGQFLEGSKPAFMYSGEVHYFRLQPSEWPDRVKKVLDMGCNCLSTYIPWLYHEPEEGTYLFGQGQRNLEGFLDICANAGLSVVLRPGPYIYSETRNMGLPLWLPKKYPQVLAQKADGSTMSPHSISYLHPDFLRLVQRWYSAVCPIIARHTMTKGGPVALVQLDNELMGVHDWFGGLDTNPEAMGIGKAEGLYPVWLSRKYSTVDDLNEAYTTTFKSFTEAKPALNGNLKMQMDYRDFYDYATAIYLQTLADMAASHGIDVPFAHNSPGPAFNPHFLETKEAMGTDDFILGTDHYYSLTPKFTQDRPTAQWFIKCYASIEMLRLMGYRPTLFEAHGGSLSDFPPLTARDTACATWGNLALGIKGFNFYMLAGGINPEGIGETGVLYDYQSPISANGQLKGSYFELQKIGEYLHSHGDLQDAEMATDLDIGMVWEYARNKDLQQQWSLEMNFDAAWSSTTDGVLTSAFFSGFSPGFVDLRGELDPHSGKPIWLVAASSLSRSIQERLLEYIDQGGNLIISPIIPHLDENLLPCTVLRDAMSPQLTHSVHYGTAALEAAGVRQVWVNKRLFTFQGLDSCPNPVETIATECMTGATAGFRVGLGRGTITVLGLDWFYAKNEHSEMFTNIIASAGGKKVISSSPTHLIQVLRHNPNTGNGYLFSINPWSTPLESHVTLTTGQQIQVSVPEMGVMVNKVGGV